MLCHKKLSPEVRRTFTEWKLVSSLSEPVTIKFKVIYNAGIDQNLNCILLRDLFIYLMCVPECVHHRWWWVTTGCRKPNSGLSSLLDYILKVVQVTRGSIPCQANHKITNFRVRTSEERCVHCLAYSVRATFLFPSQAVAPTAENGVSGSNRCSLGKSNPKGEGIKGKSCYARLFKIGLE